MPGVIRTSRHIPVVDLCIRAIGASFPLIITNRAAARIVACPCLGHLSIRHGSLGRVGLSQGRAPQIRAQVSNRCSNGRADDLMI